MTETLVLKIVGFAALIGLIYLLSKVQPSIRNPEEHEGAGFGALIDQNRKED